MPRRLAIRTAFACMLLPMLAPAARAAIPGADDPKAYTQHDYRRQRLDFNRRTLAGAYDRVGHHDPKWDEKAIRFLDAMALYFSYAKLEPVYMDQKIAPRDQMMTMAQEAADAGCDDPLVNYCRAVILHDAGHPNQAEPILDRAARGLIDRNYPACRQVAAAMRLAAVLKPFPNSAPFVARAKKAAWDAAVAALTERVDDKDLRPTLEIADDVFDAASTDQKLQFCQALDRAATASPWVVNLLHGRAEIEAAWDVRGRGFANTVTDDGWKGFFEHLAKARDYLVKAHALHPDFPEAATQMIKVAMGAGDRPNESTRDWFDKACRAQFDYTPAYDAYLFSIYPRWHGSHLMMFQFGQECVATGRYDTDVPYYLVRIIHRISGDDEERDPTGLRVLAIPQVYAAVEKLFTTLVERATDPAVKARYASEHIAVAWRAGRYDRAAAVMDAYDGRIDPKPFADLLAWAPGALSEVRLMTSKQAKAATAADRDARDGKFAPAKAAYQAVADNLPADHPGQLFVHYRIRAMEIQAALAAGTDWVSLAPAADFAPWTLVTGDFKLLKDGVIESTGNDAGTSLLLCRADLGPAYEIRATVETDGNRMAVPAVYVNWFYSRGFGAAALAPGVNAAYALGSRTTQKPVTVNGPTVLGARVDGKRFTLTVNGQDVIPDARLNPRTPTHDVFAGIGMRGQSAGRVVRFSKIEVRRLEPGKQ